MINHEQSLGLRGRDIVCVGFAEWESEVWTNQQHLMSRLSAQNEILFVESLGLRRPQLAGRDMRRIVRRLATGLRGTRRVGTVSVLAPLVVPLHSHALVRSFNGLILRRTVQRAVERLQMSAPILWAYVPQAEELVTALSPAQIVYHCVDDIAAQKGVDATSFRAAEARFASRADLVLASSPRLVERMSAFSKNVVYAPNVADVGLFAEALGPGPAAPEITAIPEPRLVFTGAITATKLDFDLLIRIASLRPSWQIVLVGPVGAGDPTSDPAALTALPNVHLIGTRSQDDLPAILRGCAAGLIPYAQNELTASIFPMKVYEYMAAGLPVIATPLPTLRDVDGVTLAADAETTVVAVEAAMKDDSEETRRERSALAEGHSWEARIAEIDGALRGLAS